MSLLICPSALFNSDASFCRLMEMCLGDQQYVTLLFYLDDICIFASSVDKMLDRIGLVLHWLQDFNLKIKLKKSYFFQLKVIFLGHVLSKKEFPQIQKRSKLGQHLSPLRKVIPFWA